MSIESVMPSNHFILCHPLLLLLSILAQHQGLFQWVSSSHQVANTLFGTFLLKQTRYSESTRQGSCPGGIWGLMQRELTWWWVERLQVLLDGLPWWLSWYRIHLQCRRPWFDSWVRKSCWRRDRLPTPVFLGFPSGSAGKESSCSVGDLGSIPGLGRSSGEGKGYPLQYSGLENSMDCIVHGVAESDTTEWLSLHFHFHWLVGTGAKWEQKVMILQGQAQIPLHSWKLPWVSQGISFFQFL